MPLRRRPIARIATTAVVAGTAANMGARSAQRSAAAAQAEAAQAQAARPPAPAPVDESAAPEATESTEIEQLKQFAALRDQGILTEEEFAAKKAQILGI
jgi:Short C-terminal domain